MHLEIIDNVNTTEMDKVAYNIFLTGTKSMLLFTGTIAKYHELKSEYFSLHHIGGVTNIPKPILEANYGEITRMLIEYLKYNKLSCLIDVLNNHTLCNIKFSTRNKEVDITNNLISIK